MRPVVTEIKHVYELLTRSLVEDQLPAGGLFGVYVSLGANSCFE